MLEVFNLPDLCVLCNYACNQQISLYVFLKAEMVESKIRPLLGNGKLNHVTEAKNIDGLQQTAEKESFPRYNCIHVSEKMRM
jgi:hypothetical protein